MRNFHGQKGRRSSLGLPPAIPLPRFCTATLPVDFCGPHASRFFGFGLRQFRPLSILLDELCLNTVRGLATEHRLEKPRYALTRTDHET